jgi:uncharacterized OB-fold protein
MVEKNYVKPLPTNRVDITKPFWDGLKRREVMIQYSPSTGGYVFYPRLLSPATLADDLEWRKVSGAGKVYTFSVAYRPTSIEWTHDVPQLLAVVELDEGVKLATELVDVAPEDIHIGMRVTPVFSATADEDIVLLRFRPAEANKD